MKPKIIKKIASVEVFVSKLKLKIFFIIIYYYHIVGLSLESNLLIENVFSDEEFLRRI